jgi:hypothetical protein
LLEAPAFSSTVYFMSLSLSAALERARARFRQDVADQLRMAAAKAGLSATVTLDDERAVVEFDVALGDGTAPRIIVTFNDERDRGAGGSDHVMLGVETGEVRGLLLSLAWRDDGGLEGEAAFRYRLAELEGRTDERLPLERRGLNAAADVRTGRYAKGDVIRLLAADLKRGAPQVLAAPEQSHAPSPSSRRSSRNRARLMSCGTTASTSTALA